MVSLNIVFSKIFAFILLHVDSLKKKKILDILAITGLKIIIFGGQHLVNTWKFRKSQILKSSLSQLLSKSSVYE